MAPDSRVKAVTLARHDSGVYTIAGAHPCILNHCGNDGWNGNSCLKSLMKFHLAKSA